MVHRLKLLMAGTALLALPSVAQAQAAAEIQLHSAVGGSCGLSAPDASVLDLHDLTGPDGLLDPAKLGNTILATATIADAWCNTPHTLSLQSTAMALQQTMPYAQPVYMARRVTFNAQLVGWPFTATIRPRNDNDPVTLDVPSAYQAPSPGLRLQISKLQTLTPGGDEQAGLMLEPGSYLGTVTITLAAAD